MSLLGRIFSVRFRFRFCIFWSATAAATQSAQAHCWQSQQTDNSILVRDMSPFPLAPC